MSTHKSAWKCIRVVNDAGITSSWHILNNAGRLVQPFQKQKPRNLHYLINKFSPDTDIIKNEEKVEGLPPRDHIETKIEKKNDSFIKLPLLPFPEDLPPLSSLISPSQPSEQYLPPKLKFFSLQIPVYKPEQANLTQP